MYLACYLIQIWLATVVSFQEVLDKQVNLQLANYPLNVVGVSSAVKADGW